MQAVAYEHHIGLAARPRGLAAELQQLPSECVVLCAWQDRLRLLLLLLLLLLLPPLHFCICCRAVRCACHDGEQA